MNVSDIRIALHIRTRNNLDALIFREARRREGAARILNARTSGSISPSTDSRLRIDQRRSAQIGRGEAQRTPALGVERHRADRIAMAERQRDLGRQPLGWLEDELDVRLGERTGRLLRKATNSNTLPGERSGTKISG